MKRTITRQRITRAVMTLLVTMLTASTAWAGNVNLSVDNLFAEGTAGHWYVNMPTTGTNTLTLSDASVTTFKVYDAGGRSSTYSYNCSGTLTLTAPTGYVLQLSGSIKTYTPDNLTVYDNSEASGTKLLDAVSSTPSGYNTAITTVYSSGQSLTLYFYSDGSDNSAGLDLTVTLVDANIEYDIYGLGATTGGSIAATVSNASATQAKVGQTVTLTATPESGYVLSDLTVVDANSNAVAVDWSIWSNTATFRMPASAVTVTPTFSNDLSINMPATGTKKATIPTSVPSFKVYDDGGKSSNYSYNCSGTLTLTAPTGYVLHLSGSIKTDTSDNLTVYDNSEASGTKLLDAVRSTSNNTETAIVPVVSSGQSMTLYFYSNDYTNYAGLDLTVTLVDPNVQYNINGLGATTGGSIAATVSNASATQAKVNDVVTLTATPESGYVLSDLTVVDANSNAVAVDWSIWSNTATFRMPASAVTVTPTFSNDLSINMPATGTKTATIPTSVPSFKVYDDGGKNGDYSYSCHGTLTLTAPTGYVLQLSGSITTDTNDNLTVYDNSEANGTKLLDAVSSTSYDTKTAIPTVISSGQSLTLYFYSNNYPNSAGLNLTVTLVDASTEYDITVSTTTGGSVAASPTPAKAGQTVTLTATPESGYVLSGISVTDASAVTWDGLFFNTATFRMPASAVTVTPTFTNDLTVAGGLSINMPATGTKTATIPTDVQSFKVYDDGGASGNRSNSCSGTLTLTAPEGYVLQLSGNITTSSNFDKLTVYDNSEASGTKLLDAVSSSSNGTQTAITTVTSSGQSMTLYFSSGIGGNYAGLDLTVTLVDANKEYDITVSNPATGGSVTADKSKAKVNETVTLTATPTDATYLLSDLTVVDANSNAVAVDWSIWSNTATFTMPSSVVTVTPTFTNDLTSLFINMPVTGTKQATIPSDVTSFKVYDDGGASGKYSNNCKGTLVLTAPEGYVLQLSGNITTEKSYDKLTVYDNNAASGTKLLDAVSSTSDGTQTAITTVTSSGQSMTLYFYSDISGNYAGLNLTVDVFKPLELANYADNTDAINNNNNGMMSKVTLSDRTLLKNGDWNTLCLPFSLTAEQIAASPLAGATIKELDSTSSNLDSEGKLTLNFKDATAIMAGKPYMVKWDNTPALTISSAADWETFASNVNGGTESYEGKVVKLSADISVSTMVGTVTSGDAPENAFKGIFDGGGHTITVDINSTDRHGTAPFRYIKDATIMDVKTTGTVNGTMHCAGLVGLSEGTSYIKNCEVNVTVNCSGSHCGGILGHGKSSTTTVSDCLFSGSISNATTAAGIIYGWGDNGTHTIVNCLAAGTYTGCSGVDLLKKYEGTEVITNCYKTVNVGSQGEYTTKTGDELVALLGDGWVNNGGSVVPKRGVLTNPVFDNVTIDNTVNNVSFLGGSFKGTYAPLEITDANRNEVLLLATGNRLGYAKTDRTVANGKALGTCRAYFEIPTTTGAPAINSYELNFGEGTATSISEELRVKSEESATATGWYTLDGRRLQGKPAQKGVYIQNGKKVIIK